MSPRTPRHLPDVPQINCKQLSFPFYLPLPASNRVKDPADPARPAGSQAPREDLPVTDSAVFHKRLPG